MPLLSPEEEDALAHAARNGDAEARRRLVESNLRFVVSVAKHYAGLGVPLLDLIQEGNVGLLKAADRFDPDRGHRFCTYAVWWIRQAVVRTVNEQGRLVRLPDYMRAQIRHLAAAEASLAQELGRPPGEAELAGSLRLRPKRLEKLRLWAEEPASLDAPAAEDGSPLGDILADEGAPEPSELAGRRAAARDLDRALSSLGDAERRVLALRYGLDGEPRTLEETGRRLGVSAERARQIEASALRKLRQSAEAERLRAWVGCG